MAERLDSGYVDFYPQFNRAATRAATSALASEMIASMGRIEAQMSRQMTTAGTTAGRNFTRSFRQVAGGGLFPEGIAGSTRQEMDAVARNLANIGSFIGPGSGAVRNVETLAHATDKVARSMGFMSQSIGIASFQLQLLGFAMTTFVSGPLAALGAGLIVTGLKTAAGIEQAVNGIRVLVSPEHADMVTDFTNRMIDLAKSSGALDVEHTLKFAQNLLAAGRSLPQVESLIKSINNIGVTLGLPLDKMNLMMLAVEQMLAKGGKVSLEELRRQLGDALPGAMQIIADAMGVTTEELYKMVAAGLPAIDVVNALEKAGNSPRFLEGAIQGTGTLNAVWQSLKETIDTALAKKFLDENFKVRPEIVQGLEDLKVSLEGLIEDIDFEGLIQGFTRFVEKVDKLIEDYKSLTPEQKEFIKQLLGIVIVAGPAAIFLGYIGTALSGILGALKTLSGAASALLSFAAAAGVAGSTMALLALGVTIIALAFVAFILFTDEGRQAWADFASAIKQGFEEDIKPAFDDMKKALQDLKTEMENFLAEFGLDWESLGTIVGVVAGGIVVGILAIEISIAGAATAISGQFLIMTSAVQLFKDLWELAWPAISGQIEFSKLIIEGAINAIIAVFKFLADQFEFSVALIKGQIENVKAAIEVFKFFWDLIWNGAKQSFELFTAAFKLAIDGMGAIFDGIESRLSQFVAAWKTGFEGLQEAVKAPIKVVVGFVNDPLIKGFNIVAKAVGIGEIGAIALPFAKGGMVPGTGNKDTVPAMLTPGEGILSLAEMNKMGGPGGFQRFREQLAAYNGTQYFADGGIVGDLASIFDPDPKNILKLGSKLIDFFKDPVKRFTEGVGLPKLPGHQFGQMLTGMAKKLITGITDKLFKDGLFGTGIGGGLASGGGTGIGNWPPSPSAQRGDSGVWRRIVAIIEATPFAHTNGAGFSNAYRHGDPLWHGSGRAVDWGGFNQDALASLFYSGAFGPVLELIHSTDTRNYGISRGRPHEMGGQLWAEHKNHIHIAMDNGGALMPGWNPPIYNGTGRIEPVLNPAQADAFMDRIEGDGSGCNHTVNVWLDGIGAQIRAEVDGESQAALAKYRRGRKPV